MKSGLLISQVRRNDSDLNKNDSRGSSKGSDLTLASISSLRLYSTVQAWRSVVLPLTYLVFLKTLCFDICVGSDWNSEPLIAIIVSSCVDWEFWAALVRIVCMCVWIYIFCVHVYNRFLWRVHLQKWIHFWKKSKLLFAVISIKSDVLLKFKKLWNNLKNRNNNVWLILIVMNAQWKYD